MRLSDRRCGAFDRRCRRYRICTAGPLPSRKLGEGTDGYAAFLQCQSQSVSQFRRRRGRQAVSGKFMKPSLKTAVCALALLTVPALAQDRKVYLDWAPKPNAMKPYTGPNKPVVRIANVLAKH